MNAISQSSLSQHIWMQVSISSAIPRRENFPARSSCVRVTLVNIGPCGHFSGRTFVISDSRLSSENKKIFFRHYLAFANHVFKLLYEAKYRFLWLNTAKLLELSNVPNFFEVCFNSCFRLIASSTSSGFFVLTHSFNRFLCSRTGH